MEFKLGANLKQITIKKGKTDEEGTTEPPTATITLDVPVGRSLGDLQFFVGQEIDVLFVPLQAPLPGFLPGKGE